MNTNQITLRPFADADIPQMAAWLQKEHVARWYHDPEDWLDEIAHRHDTFAWIHHFIVVDGQTPVGFCQYYDCFDAHAMEEWYTVTQKGDTFSIDYMIGEECCLGRGLGKAIVARLTALVRDREQARAIIVQPDKENKASNGVLLANGYVFDTEKDYFIKQLV